jgi:hypothetical protein
MILETTANAIGHRAGFAASMGLPLPVIRLADGRELKVRGAKFSPTTTTLLYEAGPSDTYRHDYVVETVEDDPCANCGLDLDDHDRNELAACQTEHLAYLGVAK